jgi:arylsulfatase A-like enzyme
MGGRPSIGSMAARLHGSTGGAPPFVGYNGSYTGYLSSVHKPYKPQGGELKLNNTLTASRLHSRTDLLVGLDRLRRDVDHTGHMLALDAYTRQAVDIVTSGRVADALDMNTEDPRVRDRYGSQGNMFLTARRLIEAGVRVVGFNWGSWDTHSNNFNHLRGQLPNLDRSLHALLEDLHARGMDKDVTVVVWGEFGRTPRVNKNKGGRDHWYEVAMCFLAGGGMKTGQVVGKSSRNAERAVERPVHLLEVFATMYHNLGIDVRTTTIEDPAGRPHYLTDGRLPIHELI